MPYPAGPDLVYSSPNDGTKRPLDTNLLDELSLAGVKFTCENIVAIDRDPSGKIIFLETGSERAGLRHIIHEHGREFAQMGVSGAQIPDVVVRAVAEGKIVGYQGSDLGRPVYQLEINGQEYRMAITVGSNGFIVGANPKGRVR